MGPERRREERKGKRRRNVGEQGGEGRKKRKEEERGGKRRKEEGRERGSYMLCNKFYNGFLLDTRTMGGLPLGSAPINREQ